MNRNILCDFYQDKTAPCYVFDCDMLKKRIEEIQSILPENATLCYAIKANPFLVPALKDSDILFEVCSPGELSICETCALSPEKIVFSGVCKTKEDIERAYKLDVHTITLESPLHCTYLIDTVQHTSTSHDTNVILRLTGGNQFGMSATDVKNCIENLRTVPSVHIRGIHYFTGTQKKITKIQSEVEFITTWCDELKTMTGISFSDIEYGPGLSFDYFCKDGFDENIADVQLFADSIKDKPYHFVVELGRFIASSCGYYLTRIMDVKFDDEANQKYVIMDGGINHINYYGQIMGMKVLPVNLEKQSHSAEAESAEADYVLCGSLCTTADVVVRKMKLCNPLPGDFLIFSDIGAYSITEGIYLFLSHPLPQVFLYSSGKFSRVRGTLESYKINMVE